MGVSTQRSLKMRPIWTSLALVLASLLYVQGYTCPPGKSKKTITLGVGESVDFSTQDADSYGKNVKCVVKFKKAKKAKCELNFSCSAFTLTAKNSNCNRGSDFLKIGKEKFCEDNSPDVTVAGRTLNVLFRSNKRSKGGEGAECEATCVDPDDETPTTIAPPATTPPTPVTTTAPTTGCTCGIRKEDSRLQRYDLDDDNRVVGGETTGVNEYPWMALIVKRESSTQQSICGGSLVASKWIVTAAHCVVKTMNVTTSDDLEVAPIENFLVILGDHDITTASKTDIARGFLLEEVLVHPERADIALLKLQVEADSDIYTPICLPIPGTDYRAGTAVVAGWGFNQAPDGNDPNASMPDALQELELTVLSRFACDLSLGGESDASLCFGGGSTGACFGDSGGPLMVEEEGGWVLAGTVSGGIGGTACATFGTIGLAVEVASQSIFNFIKSNVDEEETCSPLD